MWSTGVIAVHVICCSKEINHPSKPRDLAQAPVSHRPMVDLVFPIIFIIVGLNEREILGEPLPPAQ
jgi:hypothetical protein